MIIKKFQGKTKEEALILAKKELGENIVVLTERIAKKKWYQFWMKGNIELTIAKEEEAEIAAAKQNANIAEAVAEINSLRTNLQGDEDKSEAEKAPVSKNPDISESEESMLNEKLDTIQNMLQEKWKQQEKREVLQKQSERESGIMTENHENHEEPVNEMESFLELLYNTMIENEVNQKFAEQMIQEVRQNLRADMDMEYILSQIYQKMILKFGKADCITPSDSSKAKLIYFIGPTGVGKTTTLAKLASQLSLTEHKRIALFTADTYRISATDQSKTYADIMNVPFHIIYSVEEMKTNFELYRDYDYILVDTAGHSHHNEEQLHAMNEFVHAFDDVAEKEVYLVLSATTKYRDLVSIADKYKSMTDYKIIFTKLDETSAYGNMLNLRIHTSAALSYVTNGQNVPEDIKRFDPQETVKRLLCSEE